MIDKETLRQMFYVPEDRPWFKKEAGWPDEVPKNYDFPLKSLGQFALEAAEKWPNEKLIWFLDQYMTYGEFIDYVKRMANSLHNLGYKKGDVLALLLPNSFQYVISYYAAQMLGVIVTGINPTYKPMEVLHQVRLTGAKGIVILDSLFEPTIEPILDKHKFDHIFVTNIADFMPATKRFLGKLLKKIPTGKVGIQHIKYTDLFKAKPELPEVNIDPFEDPAVYIMTGGTTGVPKAAVLTHFNLVSNAIQSRLWMFKAKPGMCPIGVIPLFHSFAMTTVMNISFALGGCMMLFPRPPSTEEFIKKVLEVVPDEGGIYLGPEVLFQRLADYPGIENTGINKKLLMAISGAGPLHRQVQEKFEEKVKAKLVEGYGLTEASPVVSAGPFFGIRTTGTIGLPFPGTDWKIADDEGNQLPYGEVGELWVAGPQVMKEYLKNPEETAETIKELDGKKWLLTGDLGTMDELGRVKITGRKKQLIKHKGYSVFPADVETLIADHPAVHEVAVAGLPDLEGSKGEIIKAWVVLEDEYKGKITENELIEWCKQNMAHYKVPKYIEFIDELPKNLIGKVMHRLLVEKDPIYLKWKEMQEKAKK